MPVISRYSLTQLEQKTETRIWASQKRASIRSYTWPWMRMVYRSELLLQLGPSTDCTQAGQLIEGLNAQNLLVGRGYDSDSIVNQAAS
jgi:hypothetical protein